MRYFAITKPGLISLSLAVCALWGCFASERITTQRANSELRASLKTIRLLRRSAPGPNGQPVLRPVTPGAQRATSV